LEIWGVDPWGDERADLRARSFLGYVLSCHVKDVSDIPEHLMNYLGREVDVCESVEESIQNVRSILK